MRQVERYKVVRRTALVERIEDAPTRSGAEVIERGDPTTAPFEFMLKTPMAERRELVPASDILDMVVGRIGRA
jgi:hypothetical protein